MRSTRPDFHGQENPLAQLEAAFIHDYLREQGYDPERLHELPDEVAHRLLAEASVYASARLAEVEARARLVEEVYRAPGLA